VVTTSSNKLLPLRMLLKALADPLPRLECVMHYGLHMAIGRYATMWFQFKHFEAAIVVCVLNFGRPDFVLRPPLIADYACAVMLTCFGSHFVGFNFH
jgi:hypothetical protein